MAKEPDFSGEEMHLPQNQPTKKSSGDSFLSKYWLPIILILVIVATALIYYFFFYVKTPTPIPETNLRPSLETNQEPESTTAKAEIQAFGAMSTSNELNSIEADLLGTDLTNLETEIPAIDSELNSN